MGTDLHRQARALSDQVQDPAEDQGPLPPPDPRLLLDGAGEGRPPVRRPRGRAEPVQRPRPRGAALAGDHEAAPLDGELRRVRGDEVRRPADRRGAERRAEAGLHGPDARRGAPRQPADVPEPVLREARGRPRRLRRRQEARRHQPLRPGVAQLLRDLLHGRPDRGRAQPPGRRRDRVHQPGLRGDDRGRRDQR